MKNMKDSAFRYYGNQAENYSEVVKNSSWQNNFLNSSK
jgi:hypothetical protein